MTARHTAQVDGFVHTMKSALNLDDLSPFERFPDRVMRKIFGYVPESILDLRSTSVTMRTHVDEFAMLPETIQLVSELHVTGCLAHKLPAVAPMAICMYVPGIFAPLFALCLKLRLGGNIDKFQRADQLILAPELDFLKVYEMTTDDPNDADESLLECIKECLGARLSKLELQGCSDASFERIEKLLEGNKIERMKFKSCMLTPTAERHLTNIIRGCEINMVQFDVYGAAPDCNPVKLLLETSSVARSIHIFQIRNFEALNERCENFLFGARNIEWASIILQMFSGKMDKLWIENVFHPKAIDENCAGILRESLPTIEKRVWFKTTCENILSELHYTSNDNIIQVDSSDRAQESFPIPARSLRIKHTSRLNEGFVGNEEQIYAQYHA
ncbi:hypothetical protein PRIPAC_81541 [Pristionchus pacificus]|uniref:Uncharacterized protein n=1 Tax=Pristionchus pacificus TaxID=54126 RepID=A0A2A6CNW7_PRIPA|nr:hypothetical protein PRIPAC_81541 [Pristionchus pacificus]|eukprot:PDM79721.1 hypothetical protein PRIPAC_32300 [Pristionchus pacificus]